MMMRVQPVLFLFIAIVLVWCAEASGDLATEPAPRPNIIVIITDDQGYGDFSFNGNPVLKTPHMDRLAAEGVRFTNFHVSPTCAPTRCSLMTGRHEFKSGVTHTVKERERMSLGAVTIADVLRGAGYRTGVFGKWHLGDEDEYQPGKRGFDEVFIHGAGGIGQTYPGSCGDAPGNRYFDPVIRHNGRFAKTKGYCTDVFFGQALKWIEMVKDKSGERKPFFAWVATNAPHGPLEVRPEDEKRYAGKVGPDVAKFFGMIANIDDNIGVMLEKLKIWDIERETVVILMNDNGGTAGVKVFNAGMRGMKGTPWEGGTRAVSVWRWPGVLKPAEVGALTAHVDVFPTLAELAHAKLDEKATKQVEGRSLMPLFMDPKTAWADRMLVTHVGRWPGPEPVKDGECSIRSARFALVHVAREKNPWQLFDLQADPGQKIDVAAENPEVVKRLHEAYDQWWKDVLPHLENETAHGPAVNPFKLAYWKQYQGPGPNNTPPPAGLRFPPSP